MLAVAAICMCLMFVTFDLGHPERFWHLLPGIGELNFPISMLSWDVIVLNGYLLLNLHICGYLIYCAYRRRKPGNVLTVEPLQLGDIEHRVGRRQVAGVENVKLSTERLREWSAGA